MKIGYWKTGTHPIHVAARCVAGLSLWPNLRVGASLKSEVDAFSG